MRLIYADYTIITPLKMVVPHFVLSVIEFFNNMELTPYVGTDFIVFGITQKTFDVLQISLKVLQLLPDGTSSCLHPRFPFLDIFKKIPMTIPAAVPRFLNPLCFYGYIQFVNDLPAFFSAFIEQ